LVTHPLTIAPIIEGKGEASAVSVLIRRIGFDLLAGTYIKVAQPYRLDSGKMRKPEELHRAIRHQAARVPGTGGILVLRDGDDADITCPVALAAALRQGQDGTAKAIEVVIAYHEYEAWLLAAVESLRSHKYIRDDATTPANPEGRRDAKGELTRLMLQTYRPTRHQAAFSDLIDLTMAQANSRSFRRMVHAVQLLAAG
jgi:hypothetical protein